MTEQTQSLRQQIRQRVTQSAQEFYGDSLEGIKSRIQNDRAHLESFAQQMPQGDSQSRVRRMLGSYDELESALDQATQDQGTRNSATQASQETWRSANGTTQQARDAAEGGTGESETGEDVTREDVTREGDARTTERSVDEQGYVMKTVLDESGGVLEEEVTGNVAELAVEEEYIDEQGRVVSRVRDAAGDAYEVVTDDGGNMVEARAI